MYLAVPNKLIKLNMWQDGETSAVQQQSCRHDKTQAVNISANTSHIHMCAFHMLHIDISKIPVVSGSH